MTNTQIKQDLDYVASVVRRRDRPSGVPAIYFLWAILIAIGFALPDFVPRAAGLYWIVAGIGGGLLSAWLGAREARRSGINDTVLGRRHGQHWMVAGLGFALCWLPILADRVTIQAGVGNFLLVGGLTYALAGVHLERPMLWSGLIMLSAYAVLSLFAPPYTWTITGLAIGASLAWAGFSNLHQRQPAVQE